MHVEQLSKQLGSLQLQHISACNMDDIITSVVNNVVDTQVSPILDSITRNAEDTHVHLYSVLRSKMEPAVALTEDIQAWMNTGRSSTSPLG